VVPFRPLEAAITMTVVVRSTPSGLFQIAIGQTLGAVVGVGILADGRKG
jgi:hypothetical protein